MLLTAGLVVVFCLGLLWANPHTFWNDDYQISILPVLADVARSWREGHWPLLSPYSWACGNLAGEYQYGTFSLFVNVVVIAVWQFPLSFGAQAAAVSIVHLAVLGAGAALLARQRRLSTPLAVMVGLVSALNGWEIGWGASDWFGALAAHAWLPWAWWAFEAATEPLPDPATRWDRLRWLLSAPFVYLVLTGGFPYTVVMLMLVTGWLAVRELAARRARSLVPLVAGWVIGLGLSAPAWLSLLASIRGSSRAEGVGPGNRAWTVPLSSLPGIVLPNWSTDWHNFSNKPALHAALEWTGAFVPVLGLVVLACCTVRRFARISRWDLGLFGVVFLLCLLPSPGIFRWSFRWLPLLHIILALIGAQAWQLLADEANADEAPAGGARWQHLLRRSGGFWAAAAVATAWLAMVIAGTANPDEKTLHLPNWVFECALAWLAADLLLPQAIGGRRWLPTLFTVVTLAATYHHLPTNCGVPLYNFNENLSRPEPLSADRLYLSFYRAPESWYIVGPVPPGAGGVTRPGSTNLFAGVRLINGYSPIMGAGVGRRLRVQTHGDIPADMAYDLVTKEAGPDGLLASFGVDGLLIARNFPMHTLPPADEWTPVFSSGDGTVYHRRGKPLPQVVGTWPGLAGGGAPRPLTVVENSRQTVRVDLAGAPEGAGVVTFRRPYFPGYAATLDGASVPVESADRFMPSVALPPGRHAQLVLQYRPPAVVWGSLASAFSLAVLAAAAAASWRQAGSKRVEL